MSEVSLYVKGVAPGFRVTRYRGTSPRKRTPLGPYRRPMPRVLGGSSGVGRFRMGEVPLCANFGALAWHMYERENRNRNHFDNFGAPPRQVRNGEGGNSMVSPQPYTLSPTPYTLHLTLNTLHPKP